MKLESQYIVFSDDGRHGDAVVYGSDDVFAVPGRLIVGVYKVDVALRREASKHFMRPVHHELIPSHVRDFEISFGEMDDSPRKKSQSRHFAPFFGDFIECLHAETDAGEFLTLSDFFANDVRETVAGDCLLYTSDAADE